MLIFDVHVDLTLKLHLISDLAYNALLEKRIITTQNGIRASLTSIMLCQYYVIYFVQETA